MYTDGVNNSDHIAFRGSRFYDEADSPFNPQEVKNECLA